MISLQTSSSNNSVYWLTIFPTFLSFDFSKHVLSVLLYTITSPPVVEIRILLVETVSFDLYTLWLSFSKVSRNTLFKIGLKRVFVRWLMWKLSPLSHVLAKRVVWFITTKALTRSVFRPFSCDWTFTLECEP